MKRVKEGVGKRKRKEDTLVGVAAEPGYTRELHEALGYQPRPVVAKQRRGSGIIALQLWALSQGSSSTDLVSEIVINDQGHLMMRQAHLHSGEERRRSGDQRRRAVECR